MTLVEPIIFIVFLSSAIGAFLIIRRKIPLLSFYFKTVKNSGKDRPLLVFFKETAEKALKDLKGLPLVRNFSFELLLQKMLFKTKIIVLKTENKISFWLVELRKRSQQKKNSYGNSQYWKEIGFIQKKVSQLKKKTKKEKAEKKNGAPE